MLRNGTCNRGFRNWRAYPHLKHLYGGLPSNIRCLSLLAYAYKAVCYIYQYAHAWFVYIHTSPQTLSMLAPQYYLENHPFLSPPHIGNKNYSTPNKLVKYRGSGRIGAWDTLLTKQQVEGHGRRLRVLSIASGFSGVWRL